MGRRAQVIRIWAGRMEGGTPGLILPQEYLVERVDAFFVLHCAG